MKKLFLFIIFIFLISCSTTKVVDEKIDSVKTKSTVQTKIIYDKDDNIIIKEVIKTDSEEKELTNTNKTTKKEQSKIIDKIKNTGLYLFIFLIISLVLYVGYKIRMFLK